MKYDIVAINKLGSSYTFYRSDLEHFKKLFNIESFIETGTAGLAATTVLASSIFNNVQTIEIAPHYYEEAKNYLKGKENVTAYLGDTSKKFDLLIKNSKPKRLYWLDAHCSGGGTGGVPGYSPIQSELAFIEKYGSEEDVILIDDIRGSYNDIDGFLELFEIRNTLNKMNKDIELYNIGDIAIAFNRKAHPNITISPLVKAMTVSRLFEPKKESIETLKEVFASEKSIIDNCGNSSETKYMLELEHGLDTIDCGGKIIYYLWKALIEFGRGDYTEAINKFDKLLASAFAHWRFKVYKYEALVKLRETEKAKVLLDSLQNQPNLMFWV